MLIKKSLIEGIDINKNLILHFSSFINFWICNVFTLFSGHCHRGWVRLVFFCSRRFSAGVLLPCGQSLGFMLFSQTHLIALACISMKKAAEPCMPLLSGNRPILLSLSSWDVFLLLWGFPLYSVVLLPSEGSPTISSHCQANQAGSHLPAHPPPLILTWIPTHALLPPSGSFSVDSHLSPPHTCTTHWPYPVPSVLGSNSYLLSPWSCSTGRWSRESIYTCTWASALALWHLLHIFHCASSQWRLKRLKNILWLSAQRLMFINKLLGHFTL